MSKEREKALAAWIGATANEPTEDLDGFRAGWDARAAEIDRLLRERNEHFDEQRTAGVERDEAREGHKDAKAWVGIMTDKFRAAERERDEARAALSVAREALEAAKHGAQVLFNHISSHLGTVTPDQVRDLEIAARNHRDDVTARLAALAPPSAVEPAKYCAGCGRVRDAHSTGRFCAETPAKPTAEEKPIVEGYDRMWREARAAQTEASALRADCKKLATEAVEQMRRAEKAEKELETANGLLARVAANTEHAFEHDKLIADIRARLSMKGAK